MLRGECCSSSQHRRLYPLTSQLLCASQQNPETIVSCGGCRSSQHIWLHTLPSQLHCARQEAPEHHVPHHGGPGWGATDGGGGQRGVPYPVHCCADAATVKSRLISHNIAQDALKLEKILHRILSTVVQTLLRYLSQLISHHGMH